MNANTHSGDKYRRTIHGLEGGTVKVKVDVYDLGTQSYHEAIYVICG